MRTAARTPAQHGADPTAAMSDGDLVARVQSDPAVFSVLYRRFFDPVYWYCFGRLGDATAAEDATSQVFTKVVVALPRYQARDAAFRSWLFRIAHNVIVDELRARRPHESLLAAMHVEAMGSSPEEDAITEERHRLLRTMLEQLPEVQRRIVELRLAGLSSGEIGELLGRRPGAIDTALWRAVTRLRELLGESDSHPEEGHDAPR